MNIDIAELVRYSLRISGCSDDLISNFDGNSTIALEFENCPDILISVQDENVVLWSDLQEFNEYIIRQRSAELLELMMEPAEHSVTGYNFISKSDERLIFECFLKNQSLNNETFPYALEMFYLTTVKVTEALK